MAPQTHRERSGQLAGSHVLVVDDERVLRSLLRGLLEDEGITVTEAANGAEALQCLLVADQPFDAILLDLSMPVMDGRTFYRQMRADGHDAPVLLLSAYGAKRAQRELGADAALEKPFDLDDVITEVRRLLS